MRRNITLSFASLFIIVFPAIAQESEVKKEIDEQFLKNQIAQVIPGKASYRSKVELMATVVEINKDTREFEVKDARGNFLTLEAEPEIKYFDQMKVGDVVVVEYEETLSITLDKGNQAFVGSSQSKSTSQAEEGDKPSVTTESQFEVVTEVVEIDKTTQTVALRGPDEVWDFTIRDPEQFKLVDIGDSIKLVLTRGLAFKVRNISSEK